MKRKQSKRFWSLVLSLIMMLALAPAALAARFTDVPETFWCYEDVEFAVRNGLVSGTSATTYSPDKNLTYAEAIKLAACMHKKAAEGTTDGFTSGSPWYQPYVDYAKANKIITRDYVWTAPATRAGYMEIFANAIPSAGLKDSKLALTAMNRVDDNTIPDVSGTHPQAEAIYKLYRAGILQGSDAAHNCSPDSYIKRGAVAAILTRMMDPAKRISFEMANAGELKITKQPASSVSAAAGDKVQMNVSVTGGTGKQSFKWRRSLDGKKWEDVKDGTQYSGSDTQTLTVEANEETTGFLYKCWVSDSNGKYAESRESQFAISRSKLTVTKQPQDVSAQADEWVSFTVQVSGGKDPYTYRWESCDDHSDFAALPLNNPDYIKNADTATLNLRADANDWNYNFEYRCKITDALGNSVYSEPASISEAVGALRIVGQPQNMVAEEGERATATVTIDGGKGPFTYKWMYSTDSVNWTSVPNDSVFSGVGTKTLTIKADDRAVFFKYRCEITDAARNKVESNIVTFEMSFPFAFTEQPQGGTVREGKSASLTVRIRYGKDPVEFRWQVLKGGVWSDLTLGTDYTVEDHSDMSTLTIRKVTINNFSNNYRCVATDCIGQEIISNTAKINLYRQ